MQPHDNDRAGGHDLASRALASAPPAQRHADVVQHLLDAGWHIVGKANMHELAFGMTIQICDGPRASPASVDERRTEARTARLLPGDGELPLLELLAKLPADLTLAVEAPTRELRGRPFDQQARTIMERMQRFLA